MKLHLLALSFLSLAACGGAEAPKKAEAAPAAAKPEAKPEVHVLREARRSGRHHGGGLEPLRPAARSARERRG